MPSRPIVIERKRASKLCRITLHLARCPQFPEGSRNHGYSFVAPVTYAGKLDPVLWRRERSRCSAVRFWAGSPTRVGMLTRRAGGACGATWLLDFDPKRSDDDETGYRFELHRFVPGEYVTLSDASGSFVFHIDAVEDVSGEGTTGRVEGPRTPDHPGRRALAGI